MQTATIFNHETVNLDGESFAAQVDKLGERILPARWERISRVVPATISSTEAPLSRPPATQTTRG